MTTTPKADRAADLLIRARSGVLLVDLPSDLAPATIDEAYAIQDATIHRLGGHGGWKVAPAAEGEPRCSALAANAFFGSGAQLQVLPQGVDIEVETAFVFGSDLSAEDAADPGKLRSAIGSVHLAFELISSRYVDRKAVPPLDAIADLQSSNAVVLGAGISDWQSLAFQDLLVDLCIDGTDLPLPRKNAGLEPTLSALSWLGAHAAGRRLGIRHGDVVITGARLGPVPLGNGAAVRASCPGLGEVCIDFRR